MFGRFLFLYLIIWLLHSPGSLLFLIDTLPRQKLNKNYRATPRASSPEPVFPPLVQAARDTQFPVGQPRRTK